MCTRDVRNEIALLSDDSVTFYPIIIESANVVFVHVIFVCFVDRTYRTGRSSTVCCWEPLLGLGTALVEHSTHRPQVGALNNLVLRE